jgi:AhpD family alkylhydroperoxidase
MSRMTAPSHPGPLVRATLAFARRKTASIAGGEADSMIEPVEAFAHTPGLMFGYGALELANERAHRVDERLKELAVLKAATLVGCEYCIDIGSAVIRRTGLGDEQLLALPRYRESGLFDELEILVLDLAVGMTRTPVSVPEELFEALRERLGDGGVVELTQVLALENFRSRFNAAMEIGAAGFSEGMVCALPEQRAGEPAQASPPLRATEPAPKPSAASAAAGNGAAIVS